jgi:pyruvate kinase
VSRARIVATIGPASSTDDRIAALLDAGVSVCRLNFSHGPHADHGAVIARIRRIAGDRPVAVLQDLAGPKLRTTARVRGVPGDVVELPLPENVRPGDPVLLADGVMQLEVIDPARSRVLVGGDVPPRKGINLPSSRLTMPSLTDKDRVDLAFGVATGVDLVALSFVRRAADLAEAAASGVPLIAKIEKAEAVEHIDEIIAAADGIMLARGDLGVEIPIERVPVVQKRILALANRAAKPVVTATQMLRSMVENPLPTRAEATDVANALLDGTDAVMLSEETAVGRYPAEAVQVMRRILEAAEPLLTPPADDPGNEAAMVLAHAACDLAVRIGAAAIVTPTRSGASVRRVARWRPAVPIIALTADPVVRRRLSLVWGVRGILAPELGAPEHVTPARWREFVLRDGAVVAGSRIVVIAGWPGTEVGATNLLHVETV